MSEADTETSQERESMLSRLPWIITLQSVLLVVLVYPLRLQQDWLRGFLKFVRSWRGEFLADELEPIVSFLLSPLVLKGILGCLCAICFIALVIADKFLSAEKSKAAAESRTNRLRPPAYGWLILLIAWSAISALWSPTRGLSLSVLPWLIAIGSMAYLLLRRGVSFDQAKQYCVLLVILGAIASAISIMEAVEPFSRHVFKILLKFEDARNIYGSVLGHNTAAASFILITCFPALAFALSPVSGIWRIAAIGHLMLAIIAILITQSRAIWIIGAILVPAYVFLIWLRSEQPVPSWVVPLLIAMGLAGIVLQAIPARMNPFYLKQKPFAERLEDLSAETLKGEPRLRLFICSLPLVAERPLLGWGLSSYQYVYPKAQADYFALHPDSTLGYTLRRSHMAHNEYLQAAVESGLVGMALLLLALGEAFWRGLRRNLSLAPGWKPIHAALGFSSLSIALHAVVDFPLHLPQLVIPWIVCVVGFSALRTSEDGDRLPLDAEHALETGQAVRPFQVARLVGAFFVLSLIPLAAFPFARAIQADRELVLASSKLELIRQQGSNLRPADRSRTLQDAISGFRRVMQLQPHHEQVRHSLSEAYYMQALFLFEMDQAAGLSGSTPNIAAIQSVQTAIETMHDSMRYMRYHDAYYMLALYNYQLARMLRPPAKEEFENEFVSNLKTAIYYAPTHFFALKQLAEWMAQQPIPDTARIIDLRKKVRESNPYFFYENYELKILERIKARDFESAAAAAEAVLQVSPEYPEPYKNAIWAHLLAGKPENLRRVLELTQSFRNLPVDSQRYPLHPYWSSFAGLCEAIVLRQWSKAESEFGHHNAAIPQVRAMLFCIEEYVREKQGRRGLPTLFSRPEAIPEADWHRMILEERPKVLFRIFREPDRAKAAFERRLAFSGSEPAVDFWVDYAELSKQRGDAEVLRSAIEEIRRMQPRHVILPKLMAAMRGGQ